MGSGSWTGGLIPGGKSSGSVGGVGITSGSDPGCGSGSGLGTGRGSGIGLDGPDGVAFAFILLTAALPAQSDSLVVFEILHRAFMSLRCFFCPEGPEISPLPTLWTLFARVQAVFSRFQLANHSSSFTHRAVFQRCTATEPKSGRSVQPAAPMCDYAENLHRSATESKFPKQ